ncbi:HK97 family phage prohead protease [Rhodobacterales bacterium HKCCE3408]|nr:HK97 family phage prohead protease [Rhodobacterales bacterium HKCCE3408]
MSADDLHLGLPLEARATAAGIVEGYGSVFGVRDSYGDVVVKGAFAESLKARKPAFLFGHDQNRPIGKFIEIAEDGKGLRVKGQLNTRSKEGSEAFEMLRAGDLDGLSIGFRVAKGGASINHKTGIRTLTELDLYEVSAVAIPANEDARITSVKSIGSATELRDALRDLGVPYRAASKIVAGGWPMLKGLDPAEFEQSRLRAARKAAEKRSLKAIAELLGVKGN